MLSQPSGYLLFSDQVSLNISLLFLLSSGGSPIRSPLGDQGLLRRLFDHFWSPFWIQIIHYRLNDSYLAQFQAEIVINRPTQPNFIELHFLWPVFKYNFRIEYLRVFAIFESSMRINESLVSLSLEKGLLLPRE